MVLSMTIFAVGMILVATALAERTIMTSNSISKHQGVAANLINTVLNYTISLLLGFAGTVQMQVNNGGEIRRR